MNSRTLIAIAVIFMMSTQFGCNDKQSEPNFRKAGKDYTCEETLDYRLYRWKSRHKINDAEWKSIKEYCNNRWYLTLGRNALRKRARAIVDIHRLRIKGIIRGKLSFRQEVIQACKFLVKESEKTGTASLSFTDHSIISTKECLTRYGLSGSAMKRAHAIVDVHFMRTEGIIHGKLSFRQEVIQACKFIVKDCEKGGSAWFKYIHPLDVPTNKCPTMKRCLTRYGLPDSAK